LLLPHHCFRVILIVSLFFLAKQADQTWESSQGEIVFLTKIILLFIQNLLKVYESSKRWVKFAVWLVRFSVMGG
jgi:hypothetical protein